MNINYQFQDELDDKDSKFIQNQNVLGYIDQNKLENIENDLESLDLQIQQMQLSESQNNFSVLQERKLPQNNQQIYYNQSEQQIQMTKKPPMMPLNSQQKMNIQQQIPKKSSRSSSLHSQYTQNSTQLNTQQGSKIYDYKQKLKTLFSFYASFGDRINVDYLKSNSFHKMMVDAQLRDNVLTQNRLDLIFIKENQHKLNMKFETFLKVLARIAEYKYSNASNGLLLIIEKHFIPLYDNIMQQTDLGEDQQRFKTPIEIETLMILKDIQPVIRKIYEAYFTCELKLKQQEQYHKEQSQKALFLVLKDFDICPSVVTKSSAFQLYTQIFETSTDQLCYSEDVTDLHHFLGQDIGFYFTLGKFSIYLIRISTICFMNMFNNENQEPLEYGDQNESTKFKYLLERMELSTGFTNLHKKIQGSSKNNRSLMSSSRERVQRSANSSVYDLNASKLQYPSTQRESLQSSRIMPTQEIQKNLKNLNFYKNFQKLQKIQFEAMQIFDENM